MSERPETADTPVDRGTWPLERPVLTDGVVLLRGLEPGDADAVLRACQDPDIQHFTQVPVPYLPEHADGWIASQAQMWAEGTTINFAITDAQTGDYLGVVGIMAADHARREAGVGYWTAPWGRGRGATSRGVRLATRWALTEGGLVRLVAEVEEANPASTRVVEAAGFTRADVPLLEEELKGSLRRFVVWELLA